MTAPDQKYLEIQMKFLGKPTYPKQGEVADWIAGADFTSSKLMAETFSFDIRELGLDFAVPFFVIQGKADHVVSFEAAKEYLNTVHAPRKAFVAIDGGHYAGFTNPREFVQALQESVRPRAPS